DAQQTEIMEGDGRQEKSDGLAFSRKARVAEIPAGLAENLAGRKFDSVSPVDVVDDSEVGTVWRPVRFAHVIQDLARRAALERHPSESPIEEVVTNEACLRQDSHLTFGRNRKKLDAAQRLWRSSRVFRTQRKDLGRVAGRSRAVEHGLAVGRKARVKDGRMPKSELRERELAGR